MVKMLIIRMLNKRNRKNIVRMMKVKSVLSLLGKIKLRGIIIY